MGGFQLQRRTRRDRMRHDTESEGRLQRKGAPSRFRNRGNGWTVVQGLLAYHAVPTNYRCRGGCFRSVLLNFGKRALMRRSQRARRTWKQMPRLIDDWRQDHAFCILGLSGASTLSTRVGAVCLNRARTDLCGGRASNARPYRENCMSCRSTAPVAAISGPTSSACC